MSLLGSPPPQPQNPVQTSEIQQAYNTHTGEASQAGSMVNQYNPFGSMTYNQTGTVHIPGVGNVPQYAVQDVLSAPEQNLLNIMQGTQGAAGRGGYNLLSGANYGSVDPTTAIGTGASGISGQMMGGYMSLMQPFFTNQTQQLDTQLRNQGLTPSPTADPANPSTWGPYERAMYQNTTDQSRQVAGAAAQFQPQAFSEASSLYQMPEQLALQLAQFGQPNLPNQALTQTPGLSINPANYEGDVSSYNNANMQAYAADQARNSALIKGLAGTAGTIGGAIIGGPIGASAGNYLGGMLGSGAPPVSNPYSGMPAGSNPTFM